MTKNVLTAMTIVFGCLAIGAWAQSPILADVKATCSRAEAGGQVRNYIDSIIAALEEQRLDYATQLINRTYEWNYAAVTDAQRACISAAKRAAEKIEMDTREARFAKEREEHDRAVRDRAAAAEAKRNEEERLAKQPDRQLKNVYKHYIAMQSCYEARKEFELQYVSKQELEAARAITRRDEQSLLGTFPQLAKQKNSLWDDAKREYGDSDFAVLLRVLVLHTADLLIKTARS
jgi:uncharacterized protein YqgV (UPF0045/DUF77 family)